MGCHSDKERAGRRLLDRRRQDGKAGQARRQIADMVDEMKLSEQFTLRNTRGRFDSDLIYERFRSMGATKVMARAAALDLNNRNLPI